MSKGRRVRVDLGGDSSALANVCLTSGKTELLQGGNGESDVILSAEGDRAGYWPSVRKRAGAASFRVGVP